MQRVLSFPPQSTRGFGDPGEFVTKRTCFSLIFSIGFLAILAGILLGRFVFDQELELSRSKLRKAHQHHQQVLDLYRNVSDVNVSSLLSLLSAAHIEHHLESLSNDPGSGDLKRARLLRTFLKDAAFDVVSPLIQSQVNLSYPDPSRQNEVALLEGEDVVLRCGDARPRAGEFLQEARRTSATITGNVTYVNFGRDEDYHNLDSLGLHLRDSIVLARLGQVPPAELVKNALEHGAIGIVLYLDPEQGDVTDPYLSPSDLANLNQNTDQAVPVLFISARDAEMIFSHMSTSEASSEGWRGGLNSRYPIGPGVQAVLQVNTATISRKYYDILGGIRGTRDPDRFVVIGHERAADDGESTAVVMDIIRAMGILRKTKNWRPQRSIVVASWGSETRLASRSKWRHIRENAVAYLKVETDIGGNGSVIARGTPLLEAVFSEAVKKLSMGTPIFEAVLPSGADGDLVDSGVPFLEPSNSDSGRSLKDVASLWSYLTWKLSSSEELPFALDGYVRFLNRSAEAVRGFQSVAQGQNLSLESFFDAIHRLLSAVSSYRSRRPLLAGVINDRYLDFARGLRCREPSDPFRHGIFSATGRDTSSGFGVLRDMLRETTSTKAPDDLQQRITTHLAGLVECLDAARYALADRVDTFVLARNEATSIILE